MFEDTGLKGYLNGSIIVPIALGIVSGGCYHTFLNSGEFSFASPGLYLSIAIHCVLMCVLFILVDKLISFLERRGGHGEAPSRVALGKLIPGLEWKRHDIILASAIIFICWLPYLLSLFPGIYWMDTSHQTTWVIDDPAQISEWQPLMTTFLYGFFAKMGIAIADNALLGLFVLIFLQAVLTALAFSTSICHLERWGIGPKGRLALFVFVALFPAYPCMVATLVKETLAIPFLLFMFVQFSEILRTRGHCASKAGYCTLLALCLVCFNLMRKVDVYIALFSFAAVLIAVDGPKLKARVMATVIAACVVSNVLFPLCVESAMPVRPDGGQEMLSVPMQQVANVVRNHPDSFDLAERGVIDDTYLMGFAGIPDAYAWHIADGVKGYEEAPNARYDDFMGLYLRHMLPDLGDYTGAWNSLAAGWFIFDQDSTVFYSMDSTWVSSGFKELPGYVPRPYGASAAQLVSSALSSFPFTSFLFQRSLWASLLLTFCLFRIARLGRGRRGDGVRGLILLAPALLSFAVLLVGPTSLALEATRYVWSLMCLMPFCLAMVIVDTRHAD
ncbi:MAG: hypothetical protein IJH83_00735 [Coriobacteriales bacterium]|nr:hypothetical protein [Coriobacteriales bacterium]